MADNVFWRGYSRVAGGPGGPLDLPVEPPVQTGALELGAAATIGPFSRDVQFLFVSSANAGYIEFGGASVVATAASRPLTEKASTPDGGQWFGVQEGIYASLWDGTTS